MTPVVERADEQVVAERRVETIAIVAPGGYDPEPARLQRAIRHFEERGDRVVAAFDTSRHQGRFSAADDERLQRLRAATDDPEIGIVMALRGGYGATRLLPTLDFDAMARAVRRDGKRFVGHSDFTAIGLGLLATTGAISFAGPMASYDFGAESIDPFMARHFRLAMDESRVDLEFATPAMPSVAGRTIDVQGVLWGGNLTMIASLVGTPWLPVVDGGVLFVEDVNEQPYRIERMLLQLQQAGVLDRQKLVLYGDFSGYRTSAYDDGYDVAAALARVQTTTRVPIVGGLPFGHCPAKATLALGAQATVHIAAARCRLQQSWRLSD